MPRPVFSPGASDRLHQLWRRPWNESPVPPDDHQGSLRAEDRSWLERFMDEEISPRIRSVGEALEPHREAWIAPVLDTLYSDDPKEQLIEGTLPPGLGMLVQGSKVLKPASRAILNNDFLEQVAADVEEGPMRWVLEELTRTHPRLTAAFKAADGDVISATSRDQLAGDRTGTFVWHFPARSDEERMRFIDNRLLGRPSELDPTVGTRRRDSPYHSYAENAEGFMEEVPWQSRITLTPDDVADARWAQEVLKGPLAPAGYARGVSSGHSLVNNLLDRVENPAHELLHFGRTASRGDTRRLNDLRFAIEEDEFYLDALLDPESAIYRAYKKSGKLPGKQSYDDEIGVVSQRIKAMKEERGIMRQLDELGVVPGYESHTALNIDPDLVREYRVNPHAFRERLYGTSPGLYRDPISLAELPNPGRAVLGSLHLDQGAYYGGENWVRKNLNPNHPRFGTRNKENLRDLMRRTLQTSRMVPEGYRTLENPPWINPKRWMRHLEDADYSRLNLLPAGEGWGP